MEDNTIVELILLGGALVGAIVAINKYIFAPVVRRFKTWVAEFVRLKTQVNHIFAELTPNGGGSTRDKIDRIEYLLTLNNSKQRALIQDVEEGVVETDSQGRITWANRTYLRVLDASLSDVRGDGWINYVHPEDRTALLKDWELSVQKKIDLIADFRYLVNGTTIPASSRTHILKDIDGNTLGFLAVIHFDIPSKG